SLNANAQFVGDSSFLRVASLSVDADQAYETPQFLGDGLARLEGGHWVLWVRLRVANPAATGSQEAASTVDLGQISLLCHFVEYPDPPEGPGNAGIGEITRYVPRSPDTHGFPVESRWVSIRYWSGFYQQGIIEQDWSPSSALEKTWSLPGLYQLLVTA